MIRIAHRDLPSALSRRRPEGVNAAGAAGDQSRGNAIGAQDVRRSIHRVALGNTPQVKAHPADIKMNRAALGIQVDVPISDSLLHLRNFRRTGQVTLAAEESPKLHQRAHGNVKVAAGLLTGVHGILNQVEELGRNRYLALGGVAIDAGKLALRLVIAHLVVKLVDLLKNLP